MRGIVKNSEGGEVTQERHMAPEKESPPSKNALRGQIPKALREAFSRLKVKKMAGKELTHEASVREIEKYIIVLQRAINLLDDFQRKKERDFQEFAQAQALREKIQGLMEHLSQVEDFSKKLRSKEYEGQSPELMEKALEESAKIVEQVLEEIQGLNVMGDFELALRKLGSFLKKRSGFVAAIASLAGVLTMTDVPREVRGPIKEAGKYFEHPSSPAEDVNQANAPLRSFGKEPDSPSMENSGETPGVLAEGEPFARYRGDQDFL